MRPSLIANRSQRLSVVALSLWLGGFGCLFGCTAQAADGLRQTECAVHVSMAQHAARGAHSCCRRATAQPSVEATRALRSQPVNNPTYCPLAGQQANAAQK